MADLETGRLRTNQSIDRKDPESLGTEMKLDQDQIRGGRSVQGVCLRSRKDAQTWTRRSQKFANDEMRPE